MPWERLQAMLDEILAAMNRFDCPRAQQLLSEVVVEYKPAPEPHDLVWARRGRAGAGRSQSHESQSPAHCTEPGPEHDRSDRHAAPLGNTASL